MRRIVLLMLIVPAIMVVAEHRLSDGRPRGPADTVPPLWEDARHDRHAPVGPNCPFVLSLDRDNPFTLTSPGRGVTFDIDGDGDLERVAWTEPGSNLAFLAIDRDGDGQISTGRELIGRYTHPRARNGPTALTALAEDALLGERRGSVDGRNPMFGDLLLWTDANHDGKSGPAELRPAKDVVARIGLGYGRQHRRDQHGNESRYRGWVHLRTEPGLNDSKSAEDDHRRSRPMYDVCLVTQ